MRRARSKFTLAAALLAAAMLFGAGAEARAEAGAAGAAETAVTPQEAVARLEKTLAALTSFQADFEQTSYLATMARPLREKGRLSVQKPDMMRWEYEGAEPKTYVYRRGLFLTYVPEDNQLIRQRLPEEQSGADMRGLLTGKVRLSEGFTVEDSPFPGGAPGAVQIKLTPKEQEGETNYLLFEIDSRDWMVRRVVRFDWAGNKTEYAFSRFKANPKLPKDAFEIKVPADCEIIDDPGPRKK
jgi:outer membrane lipoprotein carrier protein